MVQVLWNFGSLIVGAIVTWLVSRHYYRRATFDLRQELGGEVEKMVNETHKVVEELQNAASELKSLIVAMS